MITRRPLIIDLIFNSSDNWVEFLHCNGKKFFSFKEVRKEIEDETNRSVGRNRGFSKVPINLKVYSQRGNNFVLIYYAFLTEAS